MRELIKFVERFKGEELTHAEFVQLDNLAISSDENIFWCFAFGLLGVLIGIIIAAIQESL